MYVRVSVRVCICSFICVFFVYVSMRPARSNLDIADGGIGRDKVYTELQLLAQQQDALLDLANGAFCTSLFCFGVGLGVSGSRR